MNFILDHPHILGADPRQLFFASPARRLTTLRRQTGPLYDKERGRYQLITADLRVEFDTSHACQFKYNWHRALECSLRNFVHLASLIGRPPSS